MTNGILHLSVEQILKICEHVDQPADLLSLSSSSKWFGTIVREPWAWRRHLYYHSPTYEGVMAQIQWDITSSGKPVWLHLARAAFDYCFFTAIVSALKPNDQAQVKLDCGPKAVQKLAAITSRVGSIDPSLIYRTSR